MWFQCRGQWYVQDYCQGQYLKGNWQLNNRLSSCKVRPWKEAQILMPAAAFTARAKIPEDRWIPWELLVWVQSLSLQNSSWAALCKTQSMFPWTYRATWSKTHEEDIYTFFSTTCRSIRNDAGNALDHRLTNLPLETGELKSIFQGKNSVSWVSDKVASYIAGCHHN